MILTNNETGNQQNPEQCPEGFIDAKRLEMLPQAGIGRNEAELKIGGYIL